jgi:hypothetical protein
MRPWSKERGREVSHACIGEERRETGYFTVVACSGGGGNRGGGAVGIGLGVCACAMQRRKGSTGVRERANIGPEERRRREAEGSRAVAPAIDGRGHHGLVQGKGKRPQLIEGGYLT